MLRASIDLDRSDARSARRQPHKFFAVSVMAPNDDTVNVTLDFAAIGITIAGRDWKSLTLVQSC